jgi:hypothetical protein
VVAALIDFEIGTAGEGGVDADADFAGGNGAAGKRFDADILAPVKDGGTNELGIV